MANLYWNHTHSDNFDAILEVLDFISISATLHVISFLLSSGGTPSLGTLVTVGCFFFGRYPRKPIGGDCLQIMHVLLCLHVFAL